MCFYDRGTSPFYDRGTFHLMIGAWIHFMIGVGVVFMCYDTVKGRLSEVFPIIIGNYREIIEDLSEIIEELSEICWLERCERWCDMVCGEV